MRHSIAIVLLVAALGWRSDSAAQQFIDVVVPVEIPPGERIAVPITCPDGYEPLYPTFPNPNPEDLEIKFSPIAHDGLRVSEFGGPNPGGGFFVEVINRDIFTHRGILIVRCVRPASDAPLVKVPATLTIAAGQTGIVAGTCPPGLTTVGFASNSDNVFLQERFRVFLFGTPPNLVPLNAMPDGVHPVPTRTDIGVRNLTFAAQQLNAAILCMNLFGALTRVVSGSVFGSDPHAVYAGIPDDEKLAVNSFTVNNSIRNNITLWDRKGLVSSSLRHQFPDRVARAGSNGTDHEILLDEVHGVYLEGEGVAAPVSGAKQQVVGRAIIGSIVIPSTTAVPPPTIVTIVEFYNAGLDHYFITANPGEISDLDSGVHKGWQRTGESFNAYGPGSSGRTGRRPVCRAYGNPAAGLDSHFYSASPQECVATLDNFGDDWLFEAAEVFEMELPDTTTGACAADRVPIHRLWNGRADSSHRFVKTLALRAQMIARGFVPEGYGPNGVVFCALA